MSAGSHVPVVILGGGLAGLAAAWRLQRRFVLGEKAESFGGHARSVRAQGFTFDVTGHWLHLRDDRIRALVEEISSPDEWVEVERVTRIFSHGAQLHYPFQANLHGLPPEVVQECLVGFLDAQLRQARGETQARTFEEFARLRFGDGIARHFFVPYNAKLWGEHFPRLTADWVSRYVPIPDVHQVVGGALGITQEGLGYNASFRYPKAGGIDHLPRRLVQAIEAANVGTLSATTPLEELDLAARRVKLGGHDDWLAFDDLVTTIPLPVLVERTRDVPDAVRDAAGALKWLSWRWLDVGSSAAAPEPYHWVYVPEERFDFFRVGVYSNAVESTAPPGGSSLYVELSDRVGEPNTDKIFADLVEVGALRSPDDVTFWQMREVEHAYVVFDDDYAQARDTILAWLGAARVRSCGRYGSWVYNSMEDSMIQGIEAAEAIERSP